MPQRPSTRSDYADRIRRVLRHVQQHLDEPLSPDALAEVAHFSRFHFHRVFRGMVGESVAEHVRRLRLERAAGELRRTDRKIVDIALAAGYDAHEPFTRAFRAHFGASPSEYRQAPEPIAFPRAVNGVHYGADVAVSGFVVQVEESHVIEVRIETRPARTLLGLLHRGLYQEIGPVFDRVDALAERLGLAGPDAISIGVYHDDPEMTPVEKLRSHACVTVPSGVTAPPDAEILALAGGEYAVAVHRGPHDRLHETYRWLFGQWLPASGRDPADQACHEVYVGDVRVAPEHLVTEVCVPLRPAVDGGVV